MAVSKKRKHPPKRNRPPAVVMPNTELFDRPEIIAKIKAALTQGEIIYLNKKIREDQNRLAHEAQRVQIERNWSITFRVLIDRFGFGEPEMKRFWDEVQSYANALNDPGDPLKIEDIVRSLKEEDDVELDWTGC